MASKPRAAGLKAPIGTKLGRGGGGPAALRPPSGSGTRKQSPLPSGSNRASNRTPVKSITPSGPARAGSANGNGQHEFKVGDRVLVNGKPGTLAFLGTTQFAKGQWAGVVLDSSEGKNNGAVNGVQYFQCEGNKGLFARPEKLTFLQTSTAGGKERKGASSVSSPAQPQSFEVGDRVSIDGVKEGNIAFVGETKFAKGVWVGIILDSPEGKNSGSVAGVQYFQCEEKHGLFAKPEKLTIVSKAKSSLHATSTTSTQSSSSSGQFEVGDRVLVDGLKEGLVGFLGETQFAKGIWAGIILDVPEGKNNGSVNGVQYFTCEQNHGLFTKLSKLELISRGSSGSAPVKTPVEDTVKTPVQNSGEGGNSASMPTNPVTPVDLKILQDKLNVGDHVLVGGVKEGVLRFIGPTEFAKGVWVGVELSGPMGKNDGAVSGKRYFQCEPKHGLFAPLAKVEKLATAGSEGGLSNNPSLASLSVSPSPHASPKGAGFMRAAHAQEQARRKHSGLVEDARCSDSSLSSLDSSMRDPLMGGGYGPIEPAHTVESLTQLIHERDDEIDSLQLALEERETEKKAHQEELTELRRQVDDLQFQLEEQNVISGDQLETAAESSTNQLTVIQRQLEEQKTANAQLQEQIQVLKSGGEDKSVALQNELTELKSRLQEKEQQVSTCESTIADLKQQAEQSVAIASSTGSQDQSQLETELAETRRKQEDSERRLAEMEQNLTVNGQSLQEMETQCSNLNKDLEETKAALQTEGQKVVSLEQELGDTVTLAGELQTELETCQKDLERIKELDGHKAAELQQKVTEMAAVEDKLRHISKEQELWAGERSRLLAEQERLISERDQVMAESSKGSSAEQARLNQLMQERDSLLAQQQALQTDNDRLVSDHEELLHQVDELQQQKQAVLEASQHTNIQFSTTQGELSECKSELKQVNAEMAAAKAEWEEARQALTQQIELAELHKSEARHEATSSAAERDSALQKAQELVEHLEKAERERDDMQLELETAQVQVEELQFQLDELNTRHGSVMEEGNVEMTKLQEKLESMETALNERDRELAIAKEKVQTLTDDLTASQGTRDLALVEEEKALLEEEKIILEERVNELTLQLEKSQDKGDVQPSPREFQSEALSGRLEDAQRQLLEAEASQQNYLQEIDDLKQQTDFLNSVIVDLQNKLEGVEAMKGLHGNLGSVSDYALDDEDDDIQGSLPPPRLFCDICDVFDEHDTDDCPLQAAPSDSPPHTMNHGARAPGGSDRPYCNNCEIFGHWTEDCEYEATY